VYGSGIKHTDIVHRAGKKNLCADCLSRQPVMPAPSDEDVNTEVQIAQISYKTLSTVGAMLQEEPRVVECSDDSISDAQMKDQELEPIIQYLKNGVLPGDGKVAKKVVTESILYAIRNDILYYVGPK